MKPSRKVLSGTGEQTQLKFRMSFKFENIRSRSVFRMFCMVPFEAGGLQFNGTLSFCFTSNPFSAVSFRYSAARTPSCNICNRFEAERKFAVFTAASTIFQKQKDGGTIQKWDRFHNFRRWHRNSFCNTYRRLCCSG